ncbi:Chaperone protein dnaJ 11, chloroplastic [Smittium culicis]|uniref:Chaperone protein dnaJ 11, chloroplastic n=1 Tax=Smittium culicis TaxID=133412 RepID=A0A1R1Y098_9FUNG|nr:Chaperone protein dnaJ 11, chloroplastic [Smittium culicis]
MFRKSVPSYYQILKLPTNSTKKEIKTQYYKLSLACHPDVVKRKHSLSSNIDENELKLKAESSKQEFLKISEAYRTLSNEKLRREYDKRIGVRHLNSHINFNPGHRHYPSNARREGNHSNSDFNFQRNWKKDSGSDFNTYKTYNSHSFGSHHNFSNSNSQHYNDQTAFNAGTSKGFDFKQHTMNHIKNNFKKNKHFSGINTDPNPTVNNSNFQNKGQSHQQNPSSSNNLPNLDDHRTNMKEFFEFYSTFVVSFSFIGLTAFLGYKVSSLF